MAKNINRKVTIYINGKEVENTVKSLEAELKKLRNVQRSTTIGSKEYIDTTAKMKEIQNVLDAQKKSIESVGDSWDSARKKIADYSNILLATND